ncbi:MAG TPA: DEAD/DEAH box helicase [Acidobacteriota bacterium]|nr:DEAD/DEAH box helicase [Acidobacteriota bacterium]
MKTALRPYQRIGVDWSRFLCESGLAGLLCDDMGLGKTHQAMAQMVWLRERKKAKEPFLVVCPTTVISHWLNKIREHAPKLKPVVYHGGQRNLDSLSRHAPVLLTSYGILRKDILELSRIPFLLVVGFATLTGASVDRGAIVRRFNEDPACRVYLGSLKAGGAGIDLVGGSVVIHYDRWWNAAREDQATDRVHRIGQKRAVQVFKLVTEGTLEEKIAGIVARKRRLMDSVVRADDPHLNKIFTREELIELLRPL